MILAKAPLRVSLFGGSSDLPAHYLEHSGATISMAIDKFVYVSIMYTPYDHIKISYSKQELVHTVDDIQNELIRETLKYFNIRSNIEITTFADIPTNGTGLGGSSAFLCALICAIAKYKNLKLNEYDVAELACELEINKCVRNIGKQDQYASAFGGMNYITYGLDKYQNEKITVQKINPGGLDTYCLLIPTLLNRETAHSILDTVDFTKSYEQVAELAMIAESFGTNIPKYAAYVTALNTCWDLKKKTSTEISNEEIDGLVSRCKEAGADGVKLLGAGGGGYILAMSHDKSKLKLEFRDRKCLSISIVSDGAKVVYHD